MLDGSAISIKQRNSSDSRPHLVNVDRDEDTFVREPSIVRRNRKKNSIPHTDNRIIAVTSGKGGVGKTWFSITLSHILTLLQRRVLLFDADLRLANVDVQLGLTPRHDIADLLTGGYTMDDVALTYGDGLFDVAAGRSGNGVADQVVGRGA